VMAILICSSPDRPSTLRITTSTITPTLASLSRIEETLLDAATATGTKRASPSAAGNSPPLSVAATNAAGSGGRRADAQIRPRSSPTTNSPRQSAASLRPSVAAAARDWATPSPSSCVHLNLPVNGHTLAYFQARVQARLAKRSPSTPVPHSASCQAGTVSRLRFLCRSFSETEPINVAAWHPSS
jgi:hypothetical protein